MFLPHVIDRLSGSVVVSFIFLFYSYSSLEFASYLFFFQIFFSPTPKIIFGLFARFATTPSSMKKTRFHLIAGFIPQPIPFYYFENLSIENQESSIQNQNSFWWNYNKKHESCVFCVVGLFNFLDIENNLRIGWRSWERLVGDCDCSYLKLVFWLLHPFHSFSIKKKENILGIMFLSWCRILQICKFCKF